MGPRGRAPSKFAIDRIPAPGLEAIDRGSIPVARDGLQLPRPEGVPD